MYFSPQGDWLVTPQNVTAYRDVVTPLTDPLSARYGHTYRSRSVFILQGQITLLLWARKTCFKDIIKIKYDHILLHAYIYIHRILKLRLVSEINITNSICLCFIWKDVYCILFGNCCTYFRPLKSVGVIDQVRMTFYLYAESRGGSFARGSSPGWMVVEVDTRPEAMSYKQTSGDGCAFKNPKSPSCEAGVGKVEYSSGGHNSRSY